MRRRAVKSQQPLGEDSFLDIVANLVGILIILVMVVGVRAKDALVDAAVTSDAAIEEPHRDPAMESGQLATAQMEANINELQSQMEEVHRETLVQRTYRDKLQILVTAATNTLEQNRAELSDAERQQVDLQRSLSDSQQQLADLVRSRRVIETWTPEPIVLEHLPTPLAKTVFGKEIHFRLLGGRLAYVPMNELIERLKDQWQDKLWKLKDNPEATETIGPLRGFRMQYTIGTSAYEFETKFGAVRRGMATVKGFSLIPVQQDLGWPLAEALRPQSELRAILAAHDPKSTTVTVWTYPDSFDQFRLLKKEIFQLGFLAAGRPMPDGYPIGGSPSGSRSAAQ